MSVLKLIFSNSIIPQLQENKIVHCYVRKIANLKWFVIHDNYLGRSLQAHVDLVW